MKLLLDQNISYRLVKRLENTFQGINHIKLLGLQDKSDHELWLYAKQEGFSIVTFDSDFYDLSVLFGPLPKIIWIRTGNMTTKNLEKILEQKKESIKQFILEETSKDLSCLEIFSE